MRWVPWTYNPMKNLQAFFSILFREFLINWNFPTFKKEFFHKSSQRLLYGSLFFLPQQELSETILRDTPCKVFHNLLFLERSDAFLLLTFFPFLVFNAMLFRSYRTSSLLFLFYSGAYQSRTDIKGMQNLYSAVKLIPLKNNWRKFGKSFLVVNHSPGDFLQFVFCFSRDKFSEFSFFII